MISIIYRSSQTTSTGYIIRFRSFARPLSPCMPYYIHYTYYMYNIYKFEYTILCIANITNDDYIYYVYYTMDTIVIREVFRRQERVKTENSLAKFSQRINSRYDDDDDDKLLLFC